MMKTTNAVQAAIRFLETKSASLPEISAAINMEPRKCSNLLGGLLRTGTLIRTGRMRLYVYSLSPNRVTPEQLYSERIRTVHEILANQSRITFKEVNELLNETRWAVRHFLDEACMRKDLVKQGKQGFFLSFSHYESYVENMHKERMAKRRVICAAYRAARRVSKPKVRAQQPEVHTAEINIVCEECRQNWQGYQVHKIFGSGARA